MLPCFFRIKFGSLGKTIKKLTKTRKKRRKNLNYTSLKGIVLDKQQLKKYLENFASDNTLKQKSNKKTYPIKHLEDNFEYITRTYELLNKHLKLGINIHQAGEWLLDNYYVIEETVKSVRKNLSIKKYINLVGISTGKYEGYARIYVLAEEIVNFTDGILNAKDLEEYITSYQNKKTLNMEEIWDINLFFKIALIERIKEICEKLYSSQMQKVKVENIIERLIENKPKDKIRFNLTFHEYSKKVQTYSENKYAFIEYMSFRLKKYGKKGIPYLNILEEEINRQGLNLADVIKKEHFDIALKKVAMGNCIKSIHALQRMNFLEIFENINGVEEILRQDPSGIYEKMDFKTKEYYRNKIKEISSKSKISEIYIAKKALSIAKENNGKKNHIGYYLISNGIKELFNELGITKKHLSFYHNSSNLYIYSIEALSFIFSILFGRLLYYYTDSILLSMLEVLFIVIPISEITIKIIQNVLGKIVKPKLIPKMDFNNRNR